MRIAILGTRGIPARYGGFETFAAELSRRLAEKGHEVSVHCRRYLYPDTWFPENRRLSRVLLPALRSKHLETLSHTFFSVAYLWGEALRRRPLPEVIILCNAANAIFIPCFRMLGIAVALNVDGIERQRGKWGSAGALWYRLGEWLAARFASVIVSDAEVIRGYYLGVYGAQSEVITYGYNEQEESAVEAKLSGSYGDDLSMRLAPFGLEAGRYLLYVSRLEPENNAHIVLQAYRILVESHQDKAVQYPLVIVGNAPYASEYIAGLRAMAAGDVRFLGFQFGDSYRALQLGAAVYIQATEVGGTHPALVEAMGFGNCVVANQTPENTEVLGNAGRLYPRNDVQVLSELLAELPGSVERSKLMRLARERARSHYSWSGVVDLYEALCRRLVQKANAGG